jgi:hypothetical protein
MDLYSELEKKVQAGQLTWHQILSEINQIKKQSNLPVIPVHPDSDELALDLLESHYPSAINLLIRKECYEKLKPASKRFAEVIFYLKNQFNSYNRDRAKKIGRKMGMKRKEILMAERELATYAREIACYE